MKFVQNVSTQKNYVFIHNNNNEQHYIKEIKVIFNLLEFTGKTVDNIQG